MTTLHFAAYEGSTTTSLPQLYIIYTNTYSNDLWVLVLKIFAQGHEC